MNYELIQTFAISFGLGVLVGMQRQRADSRIAGIRTFPLLTLFGTLVALLSSAFSGWVMAAGILAVTGMIVVGNVMKMREVSLKPDSDPEKSGAGQTTEAAMLLMFGIGAYLAIGDKAIAIALGAAVAVLLYLKESLHAAIDRIGDKDFKAIMLFVAISMIILPILPNQNFGPYGVLNLYNIWLMVVLIVGLSLCGYFGYKLFGERAGTLLSGLLGGVISSTATTVAYARRTANSPAASSLAAIVIMIASAIAILRSIIEIAVVAGETLSVTGPPLGIMFLVMLLLAGIAYFRHQEEETDIPEPSNPAQLKSALIFGALYALVLLGVSAAKDYLGQGGMYVVAIISGLTDMDAITLSTSNLMHNGDLDLSTGWKLIMAASLANLVFKGGMAIILGGKKLFRIIGLMFGVAIIGGLLVLFFWPK